MSDRCWTHPLIDEPPVARTATEGGGKRQRGGKFIEGKGPPGRAQQDSIDALLSAQDIVWDFELTDKEPRRAEGLFSAEKEPKQMGNDPSPRL